MWNVQQILLGRQVMTSEVQEVDVKDQIVVKLGLAQHLLQEVSQLAEQANPLASQLEVFKQVSATVFGLSKIIETVQRLRFK